MLSISISKDISGLKFPLLCCCAFKIPTCAGVPVPALLQTGLWCLILASGVNMEVKVDTVLDSVWKEALGEQQSFGCW